MQLTTRRTNGLASEMRVLLVIGVMAAACAAIAGDARAAPPTINGLKDQSILQGASLGPLLFTVADDTTPAANLIVTATSSNQTILPNDHIIVGGSGSTRSIRSPQVPGDVGASTTVTVSVSDGTETATATFVVTLVSNINYYLAEGATGPFFHTDILLTCPLFGGEGFFTRVNLTFLKEDGTTAQLLNEGCQQHERRTIVVEKIPGMAGTSFSTVVEPFPNTFRVAVERTMRWGDSGYGAHTEKASRGPAKEWFFAEGSQGFFFTYFLLVNPQTTANIAHVTYLREGLPTVTRDYQLAPQSRRTIGAVDDPALVNTSFGAHVVFDQPGMAERSMYFGMNPLFSGGTAAAGENAPSTHWLLAEGATGDYFTTFVLLANPGTQDAQATLTYLPASGQTVVKHLVVPAGQRVTRNVALEDPTLASAAVGVAVDTDQPILVERSQYWPGPSTQWYESHGSFGVTEAGTYWTLAEGGVGGPTNEQTYILLANPGTTAANVDITFAQQLATDDQRLHYTPIVKHFVVPPTSRLNVAITGPGSDVPELANEEFGATIRSTEPIVVERSFYYDADGVTWAAGTNATAQHIIADHAYVVVGPDQVNVPIGSTVTLQGQIWAFNNDIPPGGRPFQWTIIQKPAGSQATLTGADTATPSFVADVAGDYLVQLIGGRNEEVSAPETVFVTTTQPDTGVGVAATDATAGVVGPDTGTFTITRTGGDMTQPLIVNFTYVVPVSGVPYPGVEYDDDAQHHPDDPVRGSVTIPANQTSAMVTITPKVSGNTGPVAQPVTMQLLTKRGYFVSGGTATITIVPTI